MKTRIGIVLILVVAAVLSVVLVSGCIETSSVENSSTVSSNGIPGTDTATFVAGNIMPATRTETQTPEDETPSEVEIAASKKSIEAFTGKGTESLEFNGILSPPSGDIYKFGSLKEWFYVIKKTGKVEGAHFSDENKNSLANQLTPAEGEEIALDYAKKHYNFSSHNMTLMDHGGSGNEYSYSWVEYYENVMTANKVLISVNPSTGAVIDYIGIERDLPTITVPKISEEEACEIAIDSLGDDVTVTEMSSYLSTFFLNPDEQKLIWDVTITDDKSRAPILRGGYFGIDAETGEIVYYDPYL